MGLWDRLRARLGRPAIEGPAASVRAAANAPEAAPSSSGERAAVDELALFDRLGGERPPTEVELLATLRGVRGGLREAEALRRALARADALSPAARLACAEMLAARGDTKDALALAAPLRDAGALLLTADLHAALGDLPAALGAVERLLARELDAPGARERHTRWRAALGGPTRRSAKDVEPTLVAPEVDELPFRLLREVARGGAGVVYQAEDAGLGRLVAFKVYHRRGADRLALEQEVRATTSVAGPGVVPLFDADPARGWVAFEWAALGSVRDRLAVGDVARLVPLGLWLPRVAATLARLHGCRVVHGDLKPANVLLRASGEPLLADFGISRAIGEPSEPGSAGYVAPARLAGRPSDPHDDVYGFGRVLEDVLQRGGAPSALETESAAWERVAARCLDTPDVAPRDGSALVSLLESEGLAPA
jgi:hypothetical protein